MTIYFYTLLFIISLVSFIFSKIFCNENVEKKICYFIILILILVSSLRWEVGGDWETYLTVYERSEINFLKFDWSFGYELLNYLIKEIELGVWGVNLAVISIFIYALDKFAKILKFDFFLLIIIFFSLIYFNVIMGYVRQAFSLAFLILAVNNLNFKDRNFSLLFFAFASLIHLSVIVFIPVWIYLFRDKKIIIFTFILSLIILIFFNSGPFLVQIKVFLLKSYVSKGTLLRMVPLFACIIIFILNYKKLLTENKYLNIFMFYCILLTVGLIALMLSSQSFSALADRLFVYLTLFQFIVIGQYFSKVIPKENKVYLHYVSFVSIFYFTLLFVWFLYGEYSIFWLNYNFISS